MANTFIEYGKAWKHEFSKMSPTGWAFVSFFLPLMAIPLAVKGIKKGAELIKKEIDKKK